MLTEDDGLCQSECIFWLSRTDAHLQIWGLTPITQVVHQGLYLCTQLKATDIFPSPTEISEWYQLHIYKNQDIFKCLNRKTGNPSKKCWLM